MVPFKFKTIADAYNFITNYINVNGDAFYNNAGEELGKEVHGLCFEVADVTNPNISDKANSVRKLNTEYREAFKDFVLSGATEEHVLDEEYVSKLNLLSHGAAAKFLKSFGGRNTMYAPRIAKQLNHIIEELQDGNLQTANTRRATITILQAQDTELLEDKRSGKTGIEFPCTIAFNFYVKEDKVNLQVMMRSQSFFNIFCYDSYIAISALNAVADAIGLKVGSVQFFQCNAHIFKSEYNAIDKIALLNSTK